jgi:hypothetical protein
MLLRRCSREIDGLSTACMSARPKIFTANVEHQVNQGEMLPDRGPARHGLVAPLELEAAILVRRRRLRGAHQRHPEHRGSSPAELLGRGVLVRRDQAVGQHDPAHRRRELGAA